jgi:hypothetical protein
MWMAVAITALIFAIGNIYFGHFEERKPRWKRVMKIVIVTGAVAALSSTFGTLWGLVPVALMLIVAVIVHGWWLPHHGINGITGEPKEKYYELIESRRHHRS